MKKYRPSGWKLDPAEIKTNYVQLWHNGNIVTRLKKIDAQNLVIEHRAFVINDQAIGSMVDGISIS